MFKSRSSAMYRVVKPAGSSAMTVSFVWDRPHLVSHDILKKQRFVAPSSHSLRKCWRGPKVGTAFPWSSITTPIVAVIHQLDVSLTNRDMVRYCQFD